MKYVGVAGTICLAVYLLLVGFSALVGLAIPGWVAALFALFAGLLILISTAKQLP